MPKQVVMDRNGDTTHEFDDADPVSLKEAEDRFKELTGKGFIVAKSLGNGEHQKIERFDPTVEETLFIPALQGG